MNTKTTVISQEALQQQFSYCDKIAAAWQAEGRTPTAYVETYGCQQNEADSEKLRGYLVQSGYAIQHEAEGADVVSVIVHWGIERDAAPNSHQTMLARLAIDEGADLVCGHHPHVLQGIEVYKGKNIVYSLGNFCFGGNSNPSDKDTMIFQQTFTFTKDGMKEDNVTNVIPCSLSSEKSRNNYQPTPATGEEAARILKKIEDRSALIPKP